MKTLKKWIVPVLLFVFLSLAENGTGPIWYDCNPPYLLCFTVMCALFFDEKCASVFGLLSGCVCDVFSSDLFGYRAVVYAVLAYLIAVLTATVLSRNIITAPLAALAACFVSELAVWGAICLRTPVSFADAFRFVLLPRAVMSVPVSLLLYWLFTRFERRDGAPRRR